MVAMTKTIIPILICCGLMFSCNIYGQQPAYTYYTLHEGLPSNDIYNCVEDKKGFLWLATENGLSKFDGKNFKNYSTAQGLPDNDILNVLTDSAGTVWVLPFQRTPAYYDDKTDRFINSHTDKELKKILFSNVNTANALQGGGIAFCNSKGEVYIYKNKKTTEYKFSHNLKYSTTRVIALPGEKYLFVSGDSLRVIENDQIKSRQLLNRNIAKSAYVNNNLYLADSITLVKIKILPNGSMGEKKIIILPFVISTMNFTGKQLAVSSANGNIYLADTATLAFSQQAFSFNSMARYVNEDKAGNTWICTKENGIVRYQQKGILSIDNPVFQRNFNSISFFGNDIAAGTNDGQVYIYKGAYEHKRIFLKGEKDYTSWIRKITQASDRILIGSEGGLYAIDKNYKLNNYKKNCANKDFILINDSIIFTGNSGQVARLNLKTLKNTDSIRIRTTALEASTPKNVYIGSNTGLYKWENLKLLKNFGSIYPILSTRVSSLAYNKQDEILWTGLATDSLVALFNDKPIAVIPLGVKLPGNNCRALYSTKKGIVWVGTNLVLARIEYSRKGEKLNYKISVFTTTDGIAGKQINDIIERDDTVYVATTSGISILPATLRFNVIDVPVYVTEVKLNNTDTVLQNEYELDYKQKNISISFSSADLGSTTERIYEYRINKAAWITTQTENITLQQLSPGNYTIQIRAIKRDGTASAKITEVLFKIRTPFWKSIYFYILLFITGVAATFYFTQRRSSIKRERSVQKLLTEKKLSELELKALKAQINPHFVFNCLNSIKFLNHQKRFEETEIFLDKFSYLLRKTLDYSGLQKISLQDELLYSKNYLELEKLRLGDKMLYEITVDKNINVHETLVPPMLMQPYLENAVKHGIRHLFGEQGRIIIMIKKSADLIVCSITDNGLGVENMKKQQSIKNGSYQSHGLNLQQRRADLYNVRVQIKTGNAGVGTSVILSLENVGA